MEDLGVFLLGALSRGEEFTDDGTARGLGGGLDVGEAGESGVLKMLKMGTRSF